MSGAALFYKTVKVLNRYEHKNLKIKPVEGFGFAGKTHWLPVAGVEFYQASRHYPIVFVAEGEGKKEVITPILLIGLENGHNDFVDEAKRWKNGAYIPAVVRRYPFIPATIDEKNPEEFLLCYDAAFTGFNNKDGNALLNADGSDSDFLKGVVQFIMSFNNDMQQTRKFIEELKKLDLLEKRSADIRSASGVSFQVQDFLLVSEEKFAKLTSQQLASLHRDGFLGWIFAHLLSLANLPDILDIYIARKAIVSDTQL